MDPVGELHHLRVDAGTVQPRAALAPAHDPRQEPPPATLQTHQWAPGVTLSDTSKEKTPHINLSDLSPGFPLALAKAAFCLGVQKPGWIVALVDWIKTPVH